MFFSLSEKKTKKNRQIDTDLTHKNRHINQPLHLLKHAIIKHLKMPGFRQGSIDTGSGYIGSRYPNPYLLLLPAEEDPAGTPP